jgi:hypothetical protein
MTAFCIGETMKKIELTRGKVTIVDDDDFERLSQWKWFYHHEGYAVRNMTIASGKQKIILMHREILGTPNGMDSDHINGNKLDNRRINLRICTTSQNLANQDIRSDNISGRKGVCWDEHNRKWRAYIMTNCKQKNLGRFADIEDATKAYEKAATEYFGEFKRNTCR